MQVLRHRCAPGPLHQRGGVSRPHAARLLPLHTSKRVVCAKVSSIPSRSAADDEQQYAALDAATAAPSAETPQQTENEMLLQERVTQLSLNVAHYTVDGASLPADHPDHEEPQATAAVRLIPADHPEAPQFDVASGEEIPLQQRQQQQQTEEQQQAQQQQHEVSSEQQQQQQQQQRPHSQSGSNGAGARSPHNTKQQPAQLQLPRHPRFGEPLTPAFKVGDIVVGEVVHNGGSGGARVRLLEHEGVIG